MNKKINFKLSDEALEQVVGGADAENMNNKHADESNARFKRVCPNKHCKSHDPYYPGYDNGQAVFTQWGGGRAYCDVCGQEINA